MKGDFRRGRPGGRTRRRPALCLAGRNLPLQSPTIPSALCHAVFRHGHYPYRLSFHVPTILRSSSQTSPPLPLPYTDKVGCAISQNWFLFYYSVVNLFFFLSLALWYPLTSVFSNFFLVTPFSFDLLVATEFLVTMFSSKETFFGLCTHSRQFLFIHHTLVSGLFVTLFPPLYYSPF